MKLFNVVTTIVSLSVCGQMITAMPAVAKKSSSSSAQSTAPDAQKLSLSLVNITSPVKAGADATATVQTSADALCKINVKLKSGAASSKGLEPTHADKSGKATWNWKVAKNTAAGDWPVEFTASLKGSKASTTGTLKVTK
ncbi:MAG TPA: hypothetical protein V6C81_28130 [Planktothrix sp.]